MIKISLRNKKKGTRYNGDGGKNALLSRLGSKRFKKKKKKLENSNNYSKQTHYSNKKKNKNKKE